MSENSIKYLTSKEAKAALKVQDCDLAHIRDLGKLQFKKKGNSYLYLRESIEKYLLEKSPTTQRKNISKTELNK